MKNELYRHKKSDKVKWICTAVVFVLMAFMLVTLSLQVFGKDKMKPSEWFKKSDKPQAEQTVPETVASFITPMRLSSKMARASGYDSVTFSISLNYDESGNTVIFNYAYSDSIMSSPYQFDFVFKCGSRSYSWTTTELSYRGTIRKSLSNIDFFVGGFTYDVTVVVRDAESVETGADDEPWRFYKNVGSFAIPGRVVPLPPDPVKEGYHFVGWYYDVSFTRPYDNAPIYADTQLYAKFEINTYTVVYDVDGGVNVDSVSVNWNTVAPIPETTRVGYDFLGWYLSNGTKYENQPIKENTTLTARWQIKTFTVTFFVDGEKYCEKTVNYGEHFGKIEEYATTQSLQITSLRANSSSPVTDFTEFTVMENIDVHAQVANGVDKVKNTVINNWLTIALSAGGVIVFVVFISALFSHKKKKAYRR